MKLTKNSLIKSLNDRLNDEITDQRSSLYFLRNTDVFTKHYETIASVLYLYTRPKKGKKFNGIYFAELACSLGHNLRQKLGLPVLTSSAVRIGAFILYSVELLNAIKVVLSTGGNGHHAYLIEVVDDEAITKLWSGVGTREINKLPFENPPERWTGPVHPSGLKVVKTRDQSVLSELKEDPHPFIYETLNRAQSVGWLVNREVFNIYKWALKQKAKAFDPIWGAHSKEAQQTKLREVKAIGLIAEMMLAHGRPFYHAYYYDFRGRKYPATAYFHEQGPDLAKGLLMLAEGAPLGLSGYRWLMISLASEWGGPSHIEGVKTDKLTLDEAFEWAIDNEEKFLDYASSPKTNQGWMDADQPWRFISLCIELLKLRTWQHDQGDFDNYNYVSNLVCYIDGTNNGCQHLAALTRDESIAEHVNLVKSARAGDLYSYVGKHTWEHLERVANELSVKEPVERFIDDIIQLKNEINMAEPASSKREELVTKIKALKESNKALMDVSAPFFWLRIKDLKHIRKIVKRNVMTLPYGGTAYGLGEQQIKDARKHGIDILNNMEHRWGAYLGRVVFEDCRRSMRRPMRLLAIFEKAGETADISGNFLSWHTPIVNFPVVQHYTTGVVKKYWVQYGPPRGLKLPTGYYVNTLQIACSCVEDTVPAKGKQSQGASPNIIHSLDATHLMMIVNSVDFPVITVHDSFGCRFADMDVLFKKARECFRDLYRDNPLFKILNEIGGDTSKVDIGTLDVEDILNSEFAFR